jgi:anti-anti-sigma regulatory factor
MSVNFKIDRNRVRDTLTIKLMGDLDGSSAWELIHVLKKSSIGVNRIVISTNYLNHIYPFGMETLLHNFYMLDRPLRIVSSDNGAGEIILEFRKQRSAILSEYKH